MVDKTAIVTGINGQLGQYLAKHLLAQGVKVVGTLRHKTARHETYIFPLDQIKLELMDLSDASSIETLIQAHKPDYFINTAANAFVGESWRVPVQHFQINALAVLHQLEAIRKHSPHTRYLNLGTSEEFGDVKYSPQDEKHPQSPRSPYGCSKCAARHIVKVWRESYHLYAVQAWCFNFESPLRDEKYVTRKITKGVARISAAMKADQPFDPIELGNLDAKRSWQHASDVADGLWRMLNQAEPRELVLSSDETHSVREFVELAFKEAGIPGVWRDGLSHDPKDEVYLKGDGRGLATKAAIPLVRINPEFYRPNEVDQLWGDSSRARAELGWKPRHSFPDLVREMVQHDLHET